MVDHWTWNPTTLKWSTLNHWVPASLFRLKTILPPSFLCSKHFGLLVLNVPNYFWSQSLHICCFFCSIFILKNLFMHVEKYINHKCRMRWIIRLNISMLPLPGWEINVITSSPEDSLTFLPDYSTMMCRDDHCQTSYIID